MNRSTYHPNLLFDRRDPSEVILLLIQFSCLPISLFGNFLILVCIYKYNWLRTPINFLVGNLAAGDILLGVTYSPVGALGNFMGLDQYRYLCLLELFSFCTVLIVVVSNMLVISIDRYVSVTYPFTYKARALVHVRRFIPCCWVAAVCYSIVPILGWNSYGLGTGRDRCNYNTVWPHAYQLTILMYVISAVFLNIIFFAFVVRVAIVKLPERSNDKRLNRRIRKTYLMIALSALFIVCWVPYCIVSLHDVFYRTGGMRKIQVWLFLLVILNSSVNWMVYGLKTPKMRKAFEMVLKNRQVTRSITENTSSTT